KEVRRYIKRYRKEAPNNEPVFVSIVTPHTRKNVTIRHGDETVTETVKVTGKLSGNMVSQTFKEAAHRIGISNGAGQCPLRPKRFRHIFRTMGEVAGIGTDTMGILGGWQTAVTQKYLSKSKGYFLSQYIKIEKLLTIFDNPNDLVTDERLAELKVQNEELNEELTKMKNKFEELDSRFESFNTTTDEIMGYLQRQVAETIERFSEEE
ncbi:unnamed protein product, partial [marine sediment metagenome]